MVLNPLNPAQIPLPSSVTTFGGSAAALSGRNGLSVRALRRQKASNNIVHLLSSAPITDSPLLVKAIVGHLSLIIRIYAAKCANLEALLFPDGLAPSPDDTTLLIIHAPPAAPSPTMTSITNPPNFPTRKPTPPHLPRNSLSGKGKPPDPRDVRRRKSFPQTAKKNPKSQFSCPPYGAHPCKRCRQHAPQRTLSDGSQPSPPGPIPPGRPHSRHMSS